MINRRNVVEDDVSPKKKKIVLLENNMLNPAKIDKISEKSDIDIKKISINQFVIDNEKYCNNVILIADIMVEIIDDYLKNFSPKNKMNIIIISDSDRNYHTRQKLEQIKILDNIDLNDEIDSIIKIINKNMITAFD